MHGHTFDPTQDLRNLQNFLAEVRHEVGQAAYLHYGDLLWRMRNPANHFAPSADLRIWTGRDDALPFPALTKNDPECTQYPLCKTYSLFIL